MYISDVPRELKNSLKGQSITVLKGTRLRTTNPDHKSTPLFARRTYTVKVHHVISACDRRGDAYSLGKGEPLLTTPQVAWAGRGGYWTEADINEVILPGETQPLSATGSRSEWLRTEDFGTFRVLYEAERVIAAENRDGDRSRILLPGDILGEPEERMLQDELLLRNAMREFFRNGYTPEFHDQESGKDILEEISLAQSDSSNSWLINNIMNPRRRQALRR